MNKEEINQTAFQIISYSGAAFSHFFNAIEAARNNDFEKSKLLFEEGEKNLTEAHQVQTKLLVNESRGETIDCNIIMIHAQDHLMNSILLKELAKEIIQIYKTKGCGLND